MALTDIEKLRLYLGERIPVGGFDTDTFFSDDELTELIDSSEYGIAGAAVLGWAAKAGEYARLIDLNESGGDRRLSQRYRQAAMQLKYYQELTDKQVAAATASGRVVGKSIDWRGASREPRLIMWTKHYNRMPIFDAAALLNGDQIVAYDETLYDV